MPNATAQYPTVTVTSLYGAQQSTAGEVFVPATPETFGCDADGNLVSDGRWTYIWDGENRLVEMKRDTAEPTGARLRLVFEYDHQGRRIREQRYTWNSNSWLLASDSCFLYDGWNGVAELDANASNARLRTYVWGTDLSGTVEGAGGVGGLVWVNNAQTTYDGQSLPTGVHFAAYDGNGNVVALVQATDGTYSARYEYGPFGEPVRVSGPLAAAQPFRFSTKWTDAESGLLYYGYRYYNAITGRWLSRDPAEERDGGGLSIFLRNNSIENWDYLGLATQCGSCGPDVTRPVDTTIRSIKATYQHIWGGFEKYRACMTLYSPYFRGAWGIDKITQLGFSVKDFPFDPPARQGQPPPWDTTVAYQGKCYQSRDVNYIMWGTINRLCSDSFGGKYQPVWSLPWALAAVTAWKAGNHPCYLTGALLFTTAGWMSDTRCVGAGQEKKCVVNPQNTAIQPRINKRTYGSKEGI